MPGLIKHFKRLQVHAEVEHKHNHCKSAKPVSCTYRLRRKSAGFVSLSVLVFLPSVFPKKAFSALPSPSIITEVRISCCLFSIAASVLLFPGLVMRIWRYIAFNQFHKPCSHSLFICHSLFDYVTVTLEEVKERITFSSPRTEINNINAGYQERGENSTIR